MLEIGKKPQDGKNGKDGLNGRDGSLILFGDVDPTNDVGKNTDMYVNNKTFDVFYRKFDTWFYQGNIKGKKGDKGKDGTDGSDGENGKDGITQVIQRVVGGGSSGGGSSMLFEKKAVTLTSNVWLAVTPTAITEINDCEVYDDSAAERVELDIRFNPARSQVELRSKKTKTFTLFIEGK